MMMPTLGVARRAISAELLRLAEETVNSMAQEGEQPAFKIRWQRRIRCADFDQSIAARHRMPQRRT